MGLMGYQRGNYGVIVALPVSEVVVLVSVGGIVVCGELPVVSSVELVEAEVASVGPNT